MRIARSLGKRNNVAHISNSCPPTLGAIKQEARMTYMEIKALEDAGRASMVWSPEGYDGQTHYADVLKALAPALFILGAIAALMVFIL